MILKSILIFAVFLIGLSEERYQAVPLLSDEKQCTSAGRVCLAEQLSGYCYLNPISKVYDLINLKSCVDGETCSSKTGGCSKSSDPRYKFNCHQSGIFPDPYDCKKYHICSFDEDSLTKLRHEEGNCDGDLNFNPMDTRCTKSDGNCPLGVDCTRPGDTGGISSNPSLYYVCLLLDQPDEPMYSPQIFVCPRNLVFNDGKCIDPSPVSDLIDGKCPDEGDYPDVNDCRKFYSCSASGGDPTHKECVNQKFDPETKICVDFTCD